MKSFYWFGFGRRSYGDDDLVFIGISEVFMVEMDFYCKDELSIVRCLFMYNFRNLEEKYFIF